MGRVTVRDVALHVGVSTATVSLVLNNNPAVAPATRARVLRALDDLGYVYDRAAASLRGQRTNVVGLIITSLHNGYFADFVTGVQRLLADQGRVVLLGVTDEDRALQARLIRGMVERRVDGLVLIPASGTTAQDLQVVGNVPLILLARRVEGLSADYVGADNVAGARAAAFHLLVRHGCRTIAFIGGLDGSSARSEKLAGMRQALTEVADSDAARHMIAPTCRLDRLSAREVAAEVLLGPGDAAVDGVVCFNDIVAQGVLDAVGDAGLRVGVDIRVIGFDDVYGAELHRPSLSSVAVPAVDAGERAAELLLNRIGGGSAETVSVELGTHLHPRETCGCTEVVAIGA